jgi:hypothetical protein
VYLFFLIFNFFFKNKINKKVVGGPVHPNSQAHLVVSQAFMTKTTRSSRK